MAYLLHFSLPERKFTGIDIDEDKIDTANNCFSRDTEINFIFTDVLEFSFGKYDAIIMGNVLRYLKNEDQKLIIEQCISNLNPEGILVIKTDKQVVPRNRDFILTTGNAPNFSYNLVKDFAATHHMSCTETDQVKYKSETVFVLKHNRAS